MTDFEKNILSFNEQLSLKGLTFQNLEKLKSAKPDSVVLCGIGGSNIPSILLTNLWSYIKIPVPIVSWNGFGLPPIPYKNPLFIFVSFSGNTRETLSGFRLAHRSKWRAAVATGGTLLKEARAQKLSYATFAAPKALPPRQGVGFMLYGVLGIIQKMFPQVLVPDLSKKIDPAAFSQIGRSLAKDFKDKTALIYSSNQLSHIAKIFKINIHETGKSIAAINTFPEMNHNDLVAFEARPKHVAPLFLVGQDEAKALAPELSTIQAILKENRTSLKTVTIPGKTPLEIALNGVVLAQWVGLHLALLQKLNPTSTKTVDRIKELVQ